MLNTVKRTKTARRIISACFLFVFLFLLSGCASVQQDVLPEEASQPETERDPYAPLYVSEITEKTEHGTWIRKVRREHVPIEPLTYGGAKDPNKPKVTSDRMASTAGPGLDLYIGGSDLILVGTVEYTSDRLETDVITGTPVDDKIKEMTGGVSPRFGKYYHYIRPEKILWQLNGEQKLEGLIPVYQFEGEIQMKTGDRVVLFLNDRNELGWVGVCFEHGNYLVTEDGTVSSFSDYKDMSQYDGMTLEDFEAKVIGYIEKLYYAVPYQE